MVTPDCSQMPTADIQNDVSWKLIFASKMELSPSDPALLLQTLLSASSFSGAPRQAGNFTSLLGYHRYSCRNTLRKSQKDQRLSPCIITPKSSSPLNTCVRGSPQHLPCLGLHVSVLCLPHQARPKDADVINCPDRVLTVEGLSPCQPFTVKQK